MKKNRILLSIVLLIFLLVIYVGVNYTKLRSVYSKQEDIENKIKDMKIYVGGETVGIKLLATGVLVMGVDSEVSDKLNIGDIILTVNGENVDTGEKLSKIAEESNGNELNLEVNRKGKKYNTKILPKYDSISGEYKLGVFVKDSSAGVGTVTFYEGNSKRFAALGHGVTETKENYILPITSGAITSTHIYNVKRGEAQNPGEIKGTITSNVLGEIYGNTDKGIYGKYFGDIEGKKEVEILPKTKIKEGKATVIATLEDDKKEEYEIMIEKVILTSTGNKNMIIKVTDEKLLEKTGGIIQGMSGCPVMQDGKLIGFEQTFSNEEIKEMILSMCKDRILKIVEKHEDADFVYVNDLGRHRVNIYFQQGYMTAAIRIINEQIKTLEELNLPDVLHKLALLPRGLVLVTGPTGSGKSTTLAAMIDFISSMRNCHILTIEDPIEYVYQQKQALIHQREVYEDVDSFDTALKSAMREDPDVILVGEMRDYETIQAVITLAETGHLVFSTLHTIGAPKTIDRIIDVFPPHKQAQIRAQLASVLQAVVTQQLLPLASGKGRAAALEIMIANDAIKNLIRENKGHQIDTMIQTGRNEGMTTLNASLATLVNTGKVNRMVAERYSLDVGELRQLIR